MLTLLISNSALFSQPSSVAKYFTVSVSYSHNRCALRYFMEVLILSQNAKTHCLDSEITCTVTETTELSLIEEI